MLFRAPGKAMATIRYALRPGGKVSVVVFTTAAANPFMAQPMQILLHHTERTHLDLDNQEYSRWARPVSLNECSETRVLKI